MKSLKFMEQRKTPFQIRRDLIGILGSPFYKFFLRNFADVYNSKLISGEINEFEQEVLESLGEEAEASLLEVLNKLPQNDLARIITKINQNLALAEAGSPYGLRLRNRQFAVALTNFIVNLRSGKIPQVRELGLDQNIKTLSTNSSILQSVILNNL